MVNENLIPETEEVRYLNSEVPTYEEFMKSYKSDERISDSYDLENQDQALYGPQHGPSGRKKKKKWMEASGKFDEHWIDTVNGVAGESSDWWDIDESVDKSSDWHALSVESSAGASGGLGGLIAGGSAGVSAFKFSDNLGDIRVGSASVGGEIGAGAGLTAKYSAGVDAISFHTKSGVRANVGIDVGSGGSIGPTGAEIKLLGFGWHELILA